MTNLLTISDVQKQLQIPRATVYTLLRRHRVKRVKLGKRVLFREQDIEGLIAACLTPKRSAKF